MRLACGHIMDGDDNRDRMCCLEVCRRRPSRQSSRAFEVFTAPVYQGLATYTNVSKSNKSLPRFFEVLRHSGVKQAHRIVLHGSAATFECGRGRGLTWRTSRHLRTLAHWGPRTGLVGGRHRGRHNCIA